MQKQTRRPLWALLPVLVLLAALAAVPAFLPRSEAAPPAEETLAPEESLSAEESRPVEESLPAEEAPPVQEPEPTEEPEPVLDPDPAKPMLALTFDDGPSEYTDRLLNAFAAHGGRGTFFLVGSHIAAYPEAVRRAAEEGHELANHSWSHADFAKLSAAKITAEIVNTREKILETAGVESRLVRLPYGSTNKTVRAAAGETGSTLIRWNVDPQDWRYRNADTVYNAVMTRVWDGCIVLVHDIHPTTVEAMERIIPDLQAAGYQLVTVSELLEHRAEAVESIVVYPPEPEPEPPAPATPTTPATPAAPATPTTPTTPAAPATPEATAPAAPAAPVTPTAPATPEAATPTTPEASTPEAAAPVIPEAATPTTPEATTPEAAAPVTPEAAAPAAPETAALPVV